MYSPPRRSARSQPLPPTEVAVLASLTGYNLHMRCKALYEAGWTLRSIGEALNPPKSRSTVHSWIDSATPNHEIHTKIPTPDHKTAPEYERKRPVSPGISATDLENIQRLAPIARKYRAKLAPNHPATQANQGLTLICRALHADGVTITELATAAGVTYRAMSKRIAR